MEGLIQFSSRTEAIEALSQRLSFLLLDRVSTKGTASLLLSGGSTPFPVYEKLVQCPIDYKRVTFGLVDDRFVGINDSSSNEGAIRRIFNGIPGFNLLGMVSNPMDYEESINQCNQLYQTFHHGDIALLGMGNDGHFASLFPDDEPSFIGLQTKDLACIGTSAPTHPVQRISCNASLLKSIKHRILLIFGDEKWEKLCASKEEKTPISYILDELTEIYFAP
ncbi:MAG: 6-phosphogluconolactonase [Crocinitomicaceae bacterium]|jgi:6-phosphogluconolactonase